MVKTSIVNGLNRDDVAYLLAGGGNPHIEQQGKWKRGRRVRAQQASSDLSRRSGVLTQLTPNRNLHQSGKPCTEARVQQLSNNVRLLERSSLRQLRFQRQDSQLRAFSSKSSGLVVSSDEKSEKK